MFDSDDEIRSHFSHLSGTMYHSIIFGDIMVYNYKYLNDMVVKMLVEWHFVIFLLFLILKRDRYR